MCLETIQNLTLCVLQTTKDEISNEKTKYLEHFLEYFLQETVTTTTTLSDIFDTLAGTIYTLICLFTNQFYTFLTQMKQQDENLSSIIDKFVQDIGQIRQYNRKMKLSFTSKLETFVTDLRRIMKK